MAKVTSKLQVTVPKRIADRYGIQPGDEIDWLEGGEAIRVVPARAEAEDLTIERRLELFDAATKRQRERQRGKPAEASSEGRGWTRDDLYERGRAR